MSHEVNDKINNKPQAAEQDAEALFLKVHEGEKTPSPMEEIAKRLEANEKAIVEAFERIANIAARAILLQQSGEPYHFEALRECAAKGAAANEPAYKALYKHLF